MINGTDYYLHEFDRIPGDHKHEELFLLSLAELKPGAEGDITLEGIALETKRQQYIHLYQVSSLRPLKGGG